MPVLQNDVKGLRFKVKINRARSKPSGLRSKDNHQTIQYSVLLENYLIGQENGTNDKDSGVDRRRIDTPTLYSRGTTRTGEPNGVLAVCLQGPLLYGRVSSMQDPGWQQEHQVLLILAVTTRHSYGLLPTAGGE